MITSPLQLLEFCRKLDELTYQSDTFFSVNLLKLINQYFGFSDMTITVYDGSTYLGGFSYFSSLSSELSTELRRHYNQNAYQDLFSGYISKNITHFLNQSDSVQSSLLPHDIHSQHNEMFSSVGMRDTICFPITNSFRFCLMQYTSSPDISAEDIDLFCSLGLLLRAKHKVFSDYLTHKFIINLQNTTLDEIGIGTALFDKDLHLVNHSSLFATCVGKLYNTTNISACGPRLVSELLNKNQPFQEIPFTLKHYRQNDGHGILSDYYQLTSQVSPGKEVSQETGHSPLPIHLLTQRELEILNLFCVKGLSYPEIAERLFISIGTVKTHLKHIYKKFNITNQRQLIRRYLEYLESSQPQ